MRSSSFTSSSRLGFTNIESASRAVSLSDCPLAAAFSLRRFATASSTLRTRISTIVAAPATVAVLANQVCGIDIRIGRHRPDAPRRLDKFGLARLGSLFEQLADRFAQRLVFGFGFFLEPPRGFFLEIADQNISHLLLQPGALRERAQRYGSSLSRSSRMSFTESPLIGPIFFRMALMRAHASSLLGLT